MPAVIEIVVRIRPVYFMIVDMVRRDDHFTAYSARDTLAAVLIAEVL